VNIWAASIVYVIARLNFLFGPDNEPYITTDTICDHFDTVKSTTSNKATQIEKCCRVTMGEEGLCRRDITDMFTLYELPGGFVVPKLTARELGMIETECPSHPSKMDHDNAPIAGNTLNDVLNRRDKKRKKSRKNSNKRETRLEKRPRQNGEKKEKRSTPDR